MIFSYFLQTLVGMSLSFPFYASLFPVTLRVLVDLGDFFLSYTLVSDRLFLFKLQVCICS